MMAFRGYLWELGATVTLHDAVDWDAYVPDALEIITAAGMDPADDDVVVGRLTEAWNGHPAGAAVVTVLMALGCPVLVGTTPR